MTLTEAEKHSSLWQKLKADWEARLAQLRADNDKTISDAETVRLRGRIAEIKRNLDLGREKPKDEVE